MADSTLDSEKFWLIDRWPGLGFMAADVPTDGFTGTSHHNVTTAAYPVGTKINVLCTHTSYEVGLSTFVYLKIGSLYSAAAQMNAKHIVTPLNTTDWYSITNSSGSILAASGSPAAVCISTMSTTAGRYGWFWCGGICPTQYVAALDGNFGTDSTVVAGPITAKALATTSSTYGSLGLSTIATTAVNALPIGFALGADA